MICGWESAEINIGDSRDGCLTSSPRRRSYALSFSLSLSFEENGRERGSRRQRSFTEKEEEEEEKGGEREVEGSIVFLMIPNYDKSILYKYHIIKLIAQRGNQVSEQISLNEPFEKNRSREIRARGRVPAAAPRLVCPPRSRLRSNRKSMPCDGHHRARQEERRVQPLPRSFTPSRARGDPARR